MSERSAVWQWGSWFALFTLGTTMSVGEGIWPTVLWTVPLSALIAVLLFRPLDRLIDAAASKVRRRGADT